MTTSPLSAVEVQRRLAYDPATGTFAWLVPPRGVAAGSPLRLRDNGNGYLYGTIARRPYAAHRLAFAIVEGRWPVEVDHRSGDKRDNRWANLREASRGENEANKGLRSDNSSGFKGVGWHKAGGAWRACITHKGRQISLGYHSTPEAAHAAYVRAASEIFGEFARP